MNRRTATLIVALALGLQAAPLAERAAAAAPQRIIGFISSSETTMSSPRVAALRQGLRDLGHVEGESIRIEWRFAPSTEQLPALAADLVARKVSVIVAGGSEAIEAARNASATIPIVMANSGDAVRGGFVASLARPGANVTGLTQISPELAGKRLQLLKDIRPRIVRVAVLWHPNHPNTPFTFGETKAAAARLGLEVLSLEVNDQHGIDRALATLSSARADGLVVLRDPFTVRHREAIADAALKRRLPAIFESRDFVEAGGLLYYGPDLADLYRRAAGYVDRILKGGKPGALPVEQPMEFQLVVNLKTARALGLVLSESILSSATGVVE